MGSQAQAVARDSIVPSWHRIATGIIERSEKWMRALLQHSMPEMMVARLTLLLSMPEQMLKLLPETVRTRLSMTESARRFLTVKLQLLTCNQDLTPRMMRES